MNEFDEVAVSKAVDSYWADKNREQNIAVRLNMQNAMFKNADYEAELQKVAKRTGVPLETVRNNPDEVKRNHIDTTQIEQSPLLKAFLAEQQNMDIAHDDVGALSAISEVGTKLKNAGLAFWQGLDRGAADFTFGTLAAAYGTVGQVLDKPIRFVFGNNPLLHTEAGLRRAQQSAYAATDYDIPNQGVEGSIYQGVSSVGGMIPSITAATLTGGGSLVMGVGGKAAYAGANLASAGTVMGLQTAGAEYKQSRDSGLTPIQSIPYAASQAAIEVATESIPAMVFFKNLKQGAPFYKTVLNSLSAEIPSEQVATILQDANEWAVLNPEKTFKDYLSERPDRAVSTAISTITSTLILGSAGHTVQRIADRKAKKDLQAYQANVMGEVMKQTSDATRQSKLAERDPETFQTYLQSVFNQSGVENVYLSAEVLAQSGFVEKMAEVMPSVKEQVALAAETGQDLKIPAAEYFAYAPKIDTADSLLPHLKVDANGMTVAEAQEYLPKAKELLQADFEQEVAKAEQEDSFKESAQKVQDTITQQLIATGRFTSDQARIQASLTGAVYAATAKRLNITPEALFNVHQMNVVGGEPVGVELNQALKSNPPRGWVHAEGVEDAKALWRGELQRGDQPAQAVYWTEGLGKLEEQLSDLAGYSISISRSAVQHIRDHHGDAKKEKLRGQVAITEDDIASIPNIVQSYDGLLYEDIPHTNNKRFIFAKKLEDGSVIVYVADSSKKRQDVMAISMRKYPATTNVPQALKRAKSLVPTSKTGEASFRKENANTVSDESQYYQEDNAKTDYRQAYEQAVAEGRTELSYELYVQVRTPEFKAWFGDWENDPANASKVVNPRTGEPLVVYHGSPVSGFNEFNTEGEGKTYGAGAFFSASVQIAESYSGTRFPAPVWFVVNDYGETAGMFDSEEEAQEFIDESADDSLSISKGAADGGYGDEYRARGNYAVFLNIRNPAVYDFEGTNWDSYQGESTTDDLAREARENGADGAKLENVTDNGPSGSALESNVWVAFEPNQIKSATDNNGGFDSTDANIYHQSYQGVQLDREAKKFAVIQGNPVYEIGTRTAPKDNEGLRQWAIEIFNKAGNQAISPELGKVTLNERSVKDSMAHGMNALKASAFEAVPAVIEKGVVVATAEHGRTSSKYISAPVRIEGVETIVTVLVHRDMNKQQMYLHSVQTKQKLLGSAENESAADTEVSEPHGKLNPKAVTSILTHLLKGKPFKQLTTSARGSYNPATNTITLGEKADMSTFIHEQGHFYLDMMAGLATKLQQQPAENLTAGDKSILNDVQTILKWFGVESLEEWNALSMEQKREHHEKFARGFEAYAFEGKSPSVELNSVFARFSAWLERIYLHLKNLNVELSPEIRGVMDRLVATEEQIRTAQDAREMFPLFESAAQAGMTEEEFAEYKAIHAEATDEALGELDRKSMEVMRYGRNARSKVIAQLQHTAQQYRERAREEAEQIVYSRPVYIAWQWLKGDFSPEGVKALKLSRQEVKELYSDNHAIYKRLDDQGFLLNDGAPIDVVADLLGSPEIDSGDALIKALASAETPEEAIEAEIDRIMFEQHNELSSPEAIEIAADKAVHNEMRKQFIAMELDAIEKATKGKKSSAMLLAKAAKELAQNAIGNKKIRDITPGQYKTAETKAARLAQQALRKGDVKAAATYKRNQLINHAMTREVYDAQDYVEKKVRKLKRFNKEGTRKNIEQGYLDQIDQLMDKLELRDKSLKAIDRTVSLAQWAEAQRQQGIDPPLDPAQSAAIEKTHYRNMTLNDFKTLVDQIEAIEYQGRLKQKLLLERDKKTFNERRDEVVASIEANANGKVDTRTPATKWGKTLAGFNSFWQKHIKTGTKIHVMDGGKDDGVLWNLLVRTANERQTYETTRIAKLTEKLFEILKPITNKRGFQRSIYVESIQRSMTKEQIFVVGLNMGNEGNLQRVIGGENWTPEQLDAVLKHLTKEDWDAIQGIWDMFESLRPEIGELEKRLYGKEPEWIEVTPVHTPYGTYRGGYFPIKYDTEASGQAEEHAEAEKAKVLLNSAYTRPTTRSNFIKGRVEVVIGRPLIYEMSTVYSGLSDVIHRLAWQEYLVDASRLLGDAKIDKAIREHYGAETVRGLKQWLKDIAEGDKTPDGFDKGSAFIRRHVSVAALGFSVWSAIQQPIGLTQSVVRVGGKWVSKSVYDFIGNPRKMTREVREMSPFMANRSRTYLRELRELNNIIQGESKWKEWQRKYAYSMMMFTQGMVDTITWNAAYEKAVESGAEYDKAIALADQAVIDSQGGGEIKDLSEIERGTPTQKLFTVFYSFFNTQLNLAYANQKSKASALTKLKNYSWLYVLPAVLTVALKSAVTPGDDEEPWHLKILKEMLGSLINQLVYVREMQRLVDIAVSGKSYGYSGPAGLRIFTSLERTTKQVLQGELDEGLFKALIELGGSLAGWPTAQSNRTVKGSKAFFNGDTDNPFAFLFGYEGK